MAHILLDRDPIGAIMHKYPLKVKCARIGPKGSDEACLAVGIRTALLFDFNGGGSAAPPTHRLKIAISSTRAAIIVDVNTSRPDIENYGINATYSLTEIATTKVVVTGQTSGSPMTSRAKRSGLSGYADCATPKPAQPR